MKKIKILLCCLAVSFGITPIGAMGFYQDSDGSIILEMDDCRDQNRVLQLFDEEPETQDKATEGRPLIPMTFQEQDFQVAQSKLIAFVRDVNWKTGFHLTLRDATFFQRLKMVCTGINNYTKPFRVKLESFDPDLDTHLEQIENSAIDALQEKVTDATFYNAAKLSIRGIHDAIVTDKPFLLLLIDEGTYKLLVSFDPQIQDLANSMYQFFAYRSVYMGEEFNQNTKPLIKASLLGKGDAVHTWAIMATFAAKMFELAENNQLTPDQEKHNHIWRLRATMAKIKRNVKVERRAAEIAAKDPGNKAWLKQINNENPKKPTLDQEARQLLQKMTEREVKALIGKYLGK